MDYTTKPFSNSVSVPLALERPLWGAIRLGLNALQRHCEEIITQAVGSDPGGRKLLLIGYEDADEVIALLMLSLLFSHLRRANESVEFYYSQLDREVEESVLFSRYLLVHSLPSCIGLLELLEVSRSCDQIIIATGLRKEWEQLQITLPYQFYSLCDGVEEVEQDLKPILQVEQQAYQKLGDSARAYLLVALFDAWGVPLPFELLARALRRDEDEVGILIEKAQHQHLLYWIELEKPPALLVSTKAPRVAQAMIQAIREETPAEVEILSEYATVIGAVDPGEKEERYTVLNLLQAMLRGSYRWPDIQDKWQIPKTETRRSWLLRLIQTCQDKLETIWQQADAVELLLWGKLFEELREFERSFRVFQEGLRRFPDNLYLRHAQAKMLGLWARSEEARYPEAVRAFDELTRHFPDNPYTWQSWGVMEAECGKNIREARTYFDQALQTATRTSEKIYTHIAYANLELEQGFYQEASRHLQQAEELAPQYPHVLHLKGRLAFYQGEYDQAKRHLNELLASNPANLYTLHTLGVMAAKRGHWREAEEYFTHALRVHPEHLQTLHAFAELKADQGEFEAEQGHHDQAREFFQQAQAMFSQIREWEPQNPHTLVALAVLLRKWAVFEKKQGREEEAQQRFQQAECLLNQVLDQNSRNKYARHALGEVRRSQGDAQGAAEIFRRLLQDVDRENLPTLLSLAELFLWQQQPDQARWYLNLVAGLVQRRQSREPRLPHHDLIRIYNQWAQLELQLDNKEKAEELLKKSLELDPENAYTLRAYAGLLEALGQPDEAQAARNRAGELAAQSTAPEKR